MKQMRVMIWIITMVILISTVAAFPYMVETEDAGIITIDIVDTADTFDELAVVATPTSIETGDQVTANLYLELPYCDNTIHHPGYTGDIEIDFIIGSSVEYRVTPQERCDWGVYTCSNIQCGQSVQLSATYTPMEEGTWTIRYRIYNNDNQILDMDSTTFFVEDEVTNCINTDHWGSWQLTYSISHGEYRSRAYYEVGPPPNCQESISHWERKTVCDSGYVIEGTTNSQAEGLHNCVIDTSGCTPEWTCGDWGDCIDDIKRRICSDGCGETNEESEGCGVVCVPDWECTDWTTCYENITTRFCEDGCDGERIDSEACTIPNPDECDEDIMHYCPSGQTIVLQQCIEGELIPTGAECESEICNQNGICDADTGETYYNCANDCEDPNGVCPKYYYLEGEDCKLDIQLWMSEVGNYIILSLIVLLLLGLGIYIYFKQK